MKTQLERGKLTSGASEPRVQVRQQRTETAVRSLDKLEEAHLPVPILL